MYKLCLSLFPAGRNFECSFCAQTGIGDIFPGIRNSRENPDLSSPALYLSLIHISLEHRFYVRNFKEKEENGKEVYYSFDKDKKIDWTYVPTEITDQEFKSQTHRHQWMLPQAKAYRVNQNEKYIQSWIEVYSDWLNTFPCPEGTVSKDAVQWYGLQLSLIHI